MSHLIPLSRDVAANLVIDASPAAGAVDASAIRLLLLVLSQACSVPMPEDDEAAMAHEAKRIPDGELHMDDLSVDLVSLRRDMGKASLRTVRDAQAGAMAMGVTLKGETDSFGLRPPMNLTMLRADRSRSQADDADAIWNVERVLLAAATGDVANAVMIDPTVLRGLRSRYAGMLYVRSLLWIQHPYMAPQGCKARQEGEALVMDVPAAEIQHVLGVNGIAKPSQVERTVLVPAMRELRAAGIILGAKLVRNYRGEVVGLRLSVRADESLRALLAAERDRDRSAARAARRKARRLRPRKVRRIQKPRPEPVPTYAPTGNPGLDALRAGRPILQ